MITFLVGAITGIITVRSEDHWAVLVAGSNGYWNYRHQADVCHAYQVLTKNGFDPTKIITMVYDDVAHSDMNPYQGKLYNYPWASMETAVDVYQGCKIDYVGKDVSPEKFIAVLTGDKATAGGKVLESNADDHVFINFVDHGGVGLIAFPDGQLVLHANKLIDTLKNMHAKGLFGKLTFYLETCESGSMFEGLLPTDLPIYAVTAANAKESSWGTYCGSEAKVGGKDLGTCLGDLFSVNWMADSENNMKETLEQQYDIVKKKTNKSHVMQYGQVKLFDPLSVSEFQSASKIMIQPNSHSHEALELGERGSVNARDAKLHMLYQMYLQNSSRDSGEALMQEIKVRNMFRERSIHIVSHVLGDDSLAHAFIDSPQRDGRIDWTHATCHEAVVDRFGAVCGWDEENLKMSKILHRLCTHTRGNVTPIMTSLQQVCSKASIVV